MFLEISRLLNHLLAVTTQSLDLGSVTPFLWALEDREKLSYYYEAVSGARMHTAYLRAGGISLDLPIFLIDLIYKWLAVYIIKLSEIHQVITGNRI
jgi:NADH dehydrogenase (ubiquinone) Fe-S protein 2